MKQKNKSLRNIIIIVVVFILITSYSGNKEGKKAGFFSCSGGSIPTQSCGYASNEPATLAGYHNYDQEIINMLIEVFNHDGHSGEINILILEGGPDWEGIEGIIYCDRIGNTTCKEYRMMAIYQYPLGHSFEDMLDEFKYWPMGFNNKTDPNSGVITTFLKTDYKGIPYIYGTEWNGEPYSINQDPNGIYIRTNNMFIQFSAQINQDIIKKYIDTFFIYQCTE